MDAYLPNGVTTKVIRREHGLRTFARFAALSSIVLGGLGLSHCLLSSSAFASELLAYLPVMKPNAALGLLALAIALRQQVEPVASPSRLARSLAAFACLLGVLTLLEYLLGSDFHIDGLLPCGSFNNVPVNVRMAGGTAVSLALLGASLVFYDRGQQVYPAEVLTIVTGLVVALALAGYLFTSPPLARLVFDSAMALPTAATLLAMVCGILAGRPMRGLMSIINSESTGGLVARKLLPAALVLPVVLAWLNGQSQSADYHGLGFGLAFYAIVCALFFCGLIVWLATILNSRDEQRITAETALSASETKYRDLYEHAPDMHLTVAGPSALVTDCNATLADALDYAKDEIVGRSVFELYDSAGQVDAHHVHETFLATGSVSGAELRVRRKNQRLIDVQVNISAIRDSKGHIIAGRCVWRDMTDRNLAVERFHQAVEGSPNAILLVDGEGRIVLSNRAAESLFGYLNNELLRQPVEILLPARIREQHRGYRQEFLRTASVRPMGAGRDLCARRKDGSEIPVEIGLAPLHSSAGVQVLVTVTDITLRKHAEDALKASEERFRQAAAMTGDWIWEQTATGEFLYSSSAVSEILGYGPHEVIGRRYTEFFASKEGRINRYDAVAGDNKFVRLNNRYRHKDGHEVITESTGEPLFDAAGKLVRWRGVDRDITARKEAEAALLQVQKLEAVGQLTGGIAHDFNNLLTVISGNLQLIEEHVLDNAFVRERIRATLQRAARGADLVKRLLTFARRQLLYPQPVDLNQLIAGMRPLLHQTLGGAIEIVIETDSRAKPAFVDLAQVETALLNLILNARDAMPNGGTLTLKTENASLDESYALREPEVKAGDYTLISVSDTGMGMSMDTQRRAFEPFFTTKEPGKGNGLGLAMVYGLAKQSGGHVKIYSELGSGTLIKLYLPPAVSEVPEERSVFPSIKRQSGSETILVIEDDEEVRTVAISYLLNLGYHVVEARDGPSALAALERAGHAIDALFVDWILPGGMHGGELATAVRERRPGIKVLYASGYSRELTAGDNTVDKPIHFLSKPYTREQLAQALRHCLDTESD